MLLTILTKREFDFSHDLIDIVTVEKVEELEGKINAARGNYILFNFENEINFDSIETIINILKNSQSDILCFQGYKQDLNSVINKSLYIEDKIDTTFKENMDLLEDLFISNKIYRKNFLIENNLFLTASIDSFYQEFILEGLVHSKSISIHKDPVVSIINTTYPKQENFLTIEHLKKKLNLYQRICDLFKNNGFESEVPYLYSRILRIDLSSFVDYLPSLNKENREKYIDLIRQFLDQIIIPNSLLNVYDRLKYKFLVEDNLNALDNLQTFYTGISTFKNNKMVDDINLLLNLNMDDFLLEISEEDFETLYKIENISLYKDCAHLKGWIYIKYIDLLTKDSVLKTLIFKGNNKRFERKLKNLIREDIINFGYGVNYYDYAGFDQLIELGDINEDVNVFLNIKIGNIEKEVHLFNYKHAEKQIIVDSDPYDWSKQRKEPKALYMAEALIENNNLIIELGNDINFDSVDEQSSIFSRFAVFNNGKKIGQVPITHKEVTFGSFLIKNSKETFKKYNTKIKLYIDLNNFKLNGVWDIKLQLHLNGEDMYIPIEYYYGNEKLTYYDYSSILYSSENKVYLMVNKSGNKTPVVNIPNNNAEVDNLRRQLSLLTHKINYFENSLSWRVTKPLRGIKKKINNKK